MTQHLRENQQPQRNPMGRSDMFVVRVKRRTKRGLFSLAARLSTKHRRVSASDLANEAFDRFLKTAAQSIAALGFINLAAQLAA